MSDPGVPADYEIRAEGVLDARRADWFGDLRVDGDLGLCLISVRRSEPGEPGTADSRQAGEHGPAGRPQPPGEGRV